MTSQETQGLGARSSPDIDGDALKRGVDSESPRDQGSQRAKRSSAPFRLALAILVIVAVGYAAYRHDWHKEASPAIVASPPVVTVSKPLAEQLANRTEFLGQFSAVDEVEIRAQVGGVLSQIKFADGQLVHKGDPLFIIDTRPYEIKLQEAIASVKTAEARLGLAEIELSRAQQLRLSFSGTGESVDQRHADQQAASAAVDAARQAVADAQLDLDYCHVTAPFTGKISSHRISIGALVSGSRAATSPTTLLTTIVTVSPIYLNFDMSENEFLDYQQAHGDGAVSGEVEFYLSDEKTDLRRGTLEFLDNVLDRSSGTIRARATVDNVDQRLVPGEFAHIGLTTGERRAALLIPDAAVTVDQSDHVVMTVSQDETVVPKTVILGGLHEGLRIVRNGLDPEDSVIIDGLVRATPGGKVTPEQGVIEIASQAASSEKAR